MLDIGLQRTLAREVEAAELGSLPAVGPPVTGDDLASLPVAARRFFDFMQVGGQPRPSAFDALLTGRFRLAGKPWMAARAAQHNRSGASVARVFVMRVCVGRLFPMTAVDTYVRGAGRMRGRLLGVVPVAEGQGEEFDLGELATWLNDALLLAPASLLVPRVSWEGVDDRTFDVVLVDGNRTVRGRVFLDDDGVPRDFRTTDRFADLPEGLVRAPWTTPVESWVVVRGGAVPARVSAVWHLPDGPMTYFEGGFVDRRVSPAPR